MLADHSRDQLLSDMISHICLISEICVPYFSSGPMRLLQNEFLLRRAQPDGSVLGDQHILFDAHIAETGHGRGRLDGVHVAGLDATEGRLPVSLPLRA